MRHSGPGALVPASQPAPLDAVASAHPNYTSPGIAFSALPVSIGKAASAASTALHLKERHRAFMDEEWDDLVSSPFTPDPLLCRDWCSLRVRDSEDTWTKVCSFDQCVSCSECAHASLSAPPPSAASMPPVYYINLDKDVEKRALLEKALSKLPTWRRRTRVAAVDGDQVMSCLNDGSCSIPDEARVLDWNFNNSEGKLYWELHHSQIYSTKELGCVLSHIKAIQQAFSAGEQTALIVEVSCTRFPFTHVLQLHPTCRCSTLASQDDVGLDHVPHWPDSLHEVVSSAPPDWDILQLWTKCAASCSEGLVHRSPP